MITAESISIVIQIATLAGLVFGIYLYFRTPQEKSEKFDAIMEVKFIALKDEIVSLKLNHIHTLNVKLDDHIQKQNLSELKAAENFSKLFTILDERLPKR